MLTPAWTPILTGSVLDWKHFHQGGWYESATGLYHFRNRDYSPTLGTWIANDPIGFAGGYTNLYVFVGNSPSNKIDPSGLVEFKLNKTSKTLTIYVPIKFIWKGNWTHTDGSQHFRKTTFALGFKRAVESAFNNNHSYALIPKHKTILYRRRVAFPTDVRGPQITTPRNRFVWYPVCAPVATPRVWIRIVQSSPDYTVTVTAGNTPPNQRRLGYVRLGEISTNNQAFLYEDSNKDRPYNWVANGRTYSTVGNVSAHEFGHLLDLHHPGQYLDPPATLNSRADYAADPASLMGWGTGLRDHYFTKWIEEMSSLYPDHGPWGITREGWEHGIK